MVNQPFNYFNYFTEIEEYFWKKRGAHLLVSPLDWAILETWQKAGIPLLAVQKGIDRAFEAYARSKRKRLIKSLAYCVDAVLDAARDMNEAEVGKMRWPATADQGRETGLSAERISLFLEQNTKLLLEAAGRTKLDTQHPAPGTRYTALGTAFERTANELSALAASILEKSELEIRNSKLEEQTSAAGHRSPVADLEDLERRLTVLEEKLAATITANLSEEELIEIRREMDRALVPYRRKMTADQLALLEQQYTQRKLFERFRLPRLSLFYLG